MRQLADQPLRLRGQAGERERLFDAAEDFRGRGAAEPRAQAVTGRDLGADTHILEHRELRKYLGDLEGARHPERCPPGGRQRGDVASIE
jgi:hypothetical protein